MDDEVAKESARLMSIWGEFRKLKQPEKPRDRNFRWDSIHIATAHILKADRVYGFDGPWNDFPKAEIPNIGKIVVPALSPQIQLGQNTLFNQSDENTESDAVMTTSPLVAEQSTDSAPLPLEENQKPQAATIETATPKTADEDPKDLPKNEKD